MDAAEIDALNEPGYATRDEIRVLGSKMDELVSVLGRMHATLVKIEANTKKPPNFGSSYSR